MLRRRGALGDGWQQILGLLLLWGVMFLFVYLSFRPGAHPPLPGPGDGRLWHPEIVHPAPSLTGTGAFSVGMGNVCDQTVKISGPGVGGTRFFLTAGGFGGIMNNSMDTKPSAPLGREGGNG